MSGYAGAVCPRCRQGHNTYLRLSDEWEKRLTNKWGRQLCEHCKREIMIGHIKRGAAVPVDLPGYQPTNA